MGKKRIIKKSGEDTPEVAKEATVQPDLAPVSSKKALKEGRIYVSSSYNNTLISVTDASGNVVAQVSAGSVGFKGTRKSTPFAASKVADAIAQIALNKGIGKVSISVKGIGPGRDSALRTFAAKPMEILSVRDITPVPHNGPMPPKPRRV
ncbi:MAG: 30S ribosomal protein S11 [Candidatus Yanofskybacteria bacterium]|nr:30S ribosomal protein S11 [Candidatus Yanofskybacteria bacterium]